MIVKPHHDVTTLIKVRVRINDFKRTLTYMLFMDVGKKASRSDDY